MNELTAKLQKAILDIQKTAQRDDITWNKALNKIATICAQLQKAGDLSPREPNARL